MFDGCVMIPSFAGAAAATTNAVLESVRNPGADASSL
jgi:hypothetical protein